MRYGLCAHVTWGEFPGHAKTFAMASAAGVDIIRCDFNWEDLQHGPTLDFSKTDAVVADAARYGIKILPIISYGHRRLCPKPYKDPETWGGFVRAVVSRYARDCPYFEIWNEQNHKDFWKEDPAATNYLVVLRKACEVIRSVAPEAKVVVGGFAGVPFDYIEDLYKAGGGRYFDIMNIHPYTVPVCPEGRLDVKLDKLRALMVKYGDAEKPIWMTEVGWPTCERKPTDDPKALAWDEQGGVDEQTQAEFTARMIAISFAKGVQEVFPYQFRAAEDKRYSRSSGFGLVHGDFTPKPAWVAYTQFVNMCPPGSTLLSENWTNDAKVCMLQWRRPQNADTLRKGKSLGEKAGMIWKPDGKDRRILRFDSEGVRFFDLFGKEIYVRKIEQGHVVDVSGSPVFFVGDECLGFADDENGTVTTVQRPCRIVRTEGGTTLVDFGKDAFGWLELLAPKEGLGPYVLRVGEKLTASGAVDMSPGGNVRKLEVKGRTDAPGVCRVPFPPQRCHQVKTGEATPALIPESRGVVMPFRYVEVVKAPFSVDSNTVRRVALHWPMDMSASSFKSSSENLNRVYEFCKYSIWATSFAGLYVDGDRERIPYEADAYINQLGNYAIDSDYRLARKSVEYMIRHPTWPTEWKQHAIMMAWTDWMWTGETSCISRGYKWLRHRLLLELARKDGLLVSGGERRKGCVRSDLGDIVDWPANERDGFEFKPVNAVVNAFHYRNLLQMKDIAEELGKVDDCLLYARRAEMVKESFNEVLFDERTGLYVDGEGSNHSSLHANAAALSCGLVPPGRVDVVADFLVKKGMVCSVYFSQYLLEALFEAGRADAAIRLMSDEGPRSWIGMMEQGSTIAMEAWSDKVKPNQDWNHVWGTVPLNLIVKYVLGVRPIRPGCVKQAGEPMLGSLTSVEGVVPTVAGAIRVKDSVR